MTRVVILLGEPLLIHSELEAVKPVTGSLEAVARLNHAGFQVVLVYFNRSDSDKNSARVATLRQALARVGGHLAAVFEQTEEVLSDEDLIAVTARFSISPHQAVIISGALPGQISVQHRNVKNSPHQPDLTLFDDLHHAVEHFLSND